jgi:hypothetical protein
VAEKQARRARQRSRELAADLEEMEANARTKEGAASELKKLGDLTLSDDGALTDEKLKEAFDKLDEDKGGSIDKDELIAVRVPLQPCPPFAACLCVTAPPPPLFALFLLSALPLPPSVSPHSSHSPVDPSHSRLSLPPPLTSPPPHLCVPVYQKEERLARRVRGRRQEGQRYRRGHDQGG